MVNGRVQQKREKGGRKRGSKRGRLSAQIAGWAVVIKMRVGKKNQGNGEKLGGGLRVNNGSIDRNKKKKENG